MEKKAEEVDAPGAAPVAAAPASPPGPPKPISKLEWLIYALIVANTVTMCLTHDGQSEATTILLEYSNYLFTSVFALEMVIKLCLLGVRAYFHSGWNTFDFFVTWASLVDLILDMWGHDTDILRALRVARVMRLLRLNDEMRRFELMIQKAADKV